MRVFDDQMLPDAFNERSSMILFFTCSLLQFLSRWILERSTNVLAIQTHEAGNKRRQRHDHLSTGKWTLNGWRVCRLRWALFCIRGSYSLEYKGDPIREEEEPIRDNFTHGSFYLLDMEVSSFRSLKEVWLTWQPSGKDVNFEEPFHLLNQNPKLKLSYLGCLRYLINFLLYVVSDSWRLWELLVVQL